MMWYGCFLSFLGCWWCSVVFLNWVMICFECVGFFGFWVDFLIGGDDDCCVFFCWNVFCLVVVDDVFVVVFGG